ncbi:MAG: BtrH N-terminal domain-containing protein [Nitrospirae bacterium]|nr:BtrH N-terminal domain-containing protein [Nitrospirota bacterium]
MPSNIIPGWVHNPGRHCGSTSLSDLMTFSGHPFSEAFCFGLGSGLGFFFIPMDGLSPSRMVATRSAGLEPNFFHAIGQPFVWNIEEGRETAFDIMRREISAGVPLLIQCDLKYLHYYKTQTSFSGHVIVLWGFDDEKRLCYVGDTQFPGLQEVSFDDMAKARSSQAFPMPVAYNWFRGRVDSLQGGPVDWIAPALRKQASDMLEDSQFPANKGVAAIRTLADNLPGWGEVADWKWCARFTYQIIEKRGTGGGAFRLLYAEFLREAERILPALRPLRLSALMQEIGQEWSDISQLLKQESEKERPDAFESIAGRVRAQADREQKLYDTVLKHVG